jgi:hypothetical protein
VAFSLVILCFRRSFQEGLLERGALLLRRNDLVSFSPSLSTLISQDIVTVSSIYQTILKDNNLAQRWARSLKLKYLSHFDPWRFALFVLREEVIEVMGRAISFSSFGSAVFSSSSIVHLATSIPSRLEQKQENHGRLAALDIFLAERFQRPILLSSYTDSQKSPQHLAMEWLAYHDDQDNTASWSSCGIDCETHFDDVTVERFVMAVVYFATGGSDWAQSNRWMTGESICQWKSIACSSDGYVSGINLRECVVVPGKEWHSDFHCVCVALQQLMLIPRSRT